VSIQYLTAIGEVLQHCLVGTPLPEGNPLDPESKDWHRATLLRHLSFQIEVCPDTGKTPSHFLCLYHDPPVPGAVQTLLQQKCHCEIPRFVDRTFAYGVSEDKDGKRKRAPANWFPTINSGPWVYGVPAGGQGSRTDLHALTAAVKANLPSSVIEHHTATVAKHVPFFKLLRSTYAKGTRRLVRVFWLYGPPRVGKNLFLEQRYPGIFLKNSGTGHWWDLYDNETTVCINDIDADTKTTVADYMSWLDGVPLQVQTKGGFVPAMWDVVWITANSNCDEYLATRDWRQPQKDAFRARIEAEFNLPDRDSDLVECWRNDPVSIPPVRDRASHLSYLP